MPDITMDTIRKEIEVLERKAGRLRSALRDTERRRDALALTLEHFRPPEAKRARRRGAVLDISPDDLRGKTLEDALIYIAERNDGTLASTAARPVLVDAGVLRGSQVGNALWSALDRSERFEREAKGRYRLVDDHEPVPRAVP